MKKRVVSSCCVLVLTVDREWENPGAQDKMFDYSPGYQNTLSMLKQLDFGSYGFTCLR